MRAVALAAAVLLAVVSCGERAQADDAGVHQDIVNGTGNVEVTFDATVISEPAELLKLL